MPTITLRDQPVISLTAGQLLLNDPVVVALSGPSLALTAGQLFVGRDMDLLVVDLAATTGLSTPVGAVSIAAAQGIDPVSNYEISTPTLAEFSTTYALTAAPSSSQTEIEVPKLESDASTGIGWYGNTRSAFWGKFL